MYERVIRRPAEMSANLSGTGEVLARLGMLTGDLKPTQLPAKLRGPLIKNQMPMSTIMVLNGTAPLLDRAQRKRLREKKVTKTMKGTKTGVMTMLRFHASPPNVLYIRDET